MSCPNGPAPSATGSGRHPRGQRTRISAPCHSTAASRGPHRRLHRARIGSVRTPSGAGLSVPQINKLRAPMQGLVRAAAENRSDPWVSGRTRRAHHSGRNFPALRRNDEMAGTREMSESPRAETRHIKAAISSSTDDATETDATDTCRGADPVSAATLLRRNRYGTNSLSAARQSQKPCYPKARGWSARPFTLDALSRSDHSINLTVPGHGGLYHSTETGPATVGLGASRVVDVPCVAECLSGCLLSLQPQIP